MSYQGDPKSNAWYVDRNNAPDRETLELLKELVITEETLNEWERDE